MGLVLPRERGSKDKDDDETGTSLRGLQACRSYRRSCSSNILEIGVKRDLACDKKFKCGEIIEKSIGKLRS